MRWILFLASTFAVAGCSQQNTYRDDVAKQNAVEAQVRDQQLAPVIGTYCGKMRLTKSGLEFDVNIILARGDDNVHTPQSSDPTLTARSPKLAGSMRFPVVDSSNQDVSHSVPDLVQAMGGLGALPFDNGDYNPGTQQITLPFNVPNHQGQYGEVRGTFNSGRFTGSWFSNSYQTVGSFDVSQCEGNSAQ